MPEPAHPMPVLPPERGWLGGDMVELDGTNWPVEFACAALNWEPKDLRDLLRILKVKPAGTIRWAQFSRQGRQPRAYNAEQLILIDKRIRELAEELNSRFS